MLSSPISQSRDHVPSAVVGMRDIEILNFPVAKYVTWQACTICLEGWANIALPRSSSAAFYLRYRKMQSSVEKLQHSLSLRKVRFISSVRQMQDLKWVWREPVSLGWGWGERAEIKRFDLTGCPIPWSLIIKYVMFAFSSVANLVSNEQFLEFGKELFRIEDLGQKRIFAFTPSTQKQLFLLPQFN